MEAIVGLTQVESRLRSPSAKPFFLQAGSWDNEADARFAAIPSATSGQLNIKFITEKADELREQTFELVLAGMFYGTPVARDIVSGSERFRYRPSFWFVRQAYLAMNMLHQDAVYYEENDWSYVLNRMLWKMGLQFGDDKRDYLEPVQYSDFKDDAVIKRLEDSFNIPFLLFSPFAGDEEIKIVRIPLPPGEERMIDGELFNFQIRVVGKIGKAMALIESGLKDPKRRDSIIQAMKETGRLPLYTGLWNAGQVYNFLFEEVKKITLCHPR